MPPGLSGPGGERRMLAVNDLGEPCAGEPHARFDGRGLETKHPGQEAEKNSRAGNSLAHMASQPTAKICHRASPRPYMFGRPTRACNARKCLSCLRN